MGSQEFVSFIFTKENAEKFQSIREEMGLEDNSLLEFFFKLHEKNKLQLKNEYLEFVGITDKVNIEVQELESTTTTTNESDIANRCDNFPVTSKQYTADNLAIVESTCGLNDHQARLVDQESGETAKVLISLQDYQADDHTTVNIVATGDQDTQECVDTQLTDVCIDTSDIGHVEGTINIESQLINENLNQATSIEIVPEPSPHLPSPSALDAEKILEMGEKSVQSLPEQVGSNEGFVVPNLESTEVENRKRKNNQKSNSGGEQKRKRRNDVWLTRIQDADFEERRYKCHFCSAAFFHPHHLQRHEKQLHKLGKEVKPNQCKDCFKTFATQLTLKFHQDFACRMVQRPYRCPQCQLGFKSSEAVESHKCSGNPAKPLCCKECDYRTGSPRDLEHHFRIHTGERCYKCDLCDFRTAWKKNLKEHVLKHSGLKPFVCHVCNFATNDHSNLRTHLAKHLKNRLNLCHTCGTSFRGSHSLESHILLHSYAAPHKCMYCDYSTRYKFSLNSHMKTHNIENNDAKISQIVSTTAEDGTVQEVSEISVETTDPDYGTLVEKQLYICQECGFVIDNRKLFDSHKCKTINTSDPTTTAVLDGEMIIQIIESPAELPTVVET